MNLLLIQMSGVPGSGKSTLAHLVGNKIGAVVLDHDVVKSALLDAGTPWNDAGRYSYLTIQALSQSFLHQGRSVIIDSPCFYEDLLNAGLRIARETGASYRYIECVMEDLSEIDRRLQTRPSLSSHRISVETAPTSFSGNETSSGEVLFQLWSAGMKRPTQGALKVNTAKSEQECLQHVLNFLSKPDDYTERSK